MDHVPRLSEVLYVGLCRKIGTPTEVAIRRDLLDMEEMIMKPVYNQRGISIMESGSYREGFRLRSSDVDKMFCLGKYKLISDSISNFWIYNNSKHHVILMEDSDTPPGFVRLRLLTPMHAQSTKPSIVNLCYAFINGGIYISSSLMRKVSFDKFTSKERYGNTNNTIHGPCTNYFFKSIEIDNAPCFATNCCSKFLRSFVERCQRHVWPPIYVLEIILRKGCHCVPIGSTCKLVSNSNELEWRLSFSQAEQQLVCTMNHTQFLCYGLLKIFLKEVINYRQKTILCSYFMKTTMFWMMQLGNVSWHPNNLLNCFWKCYKFLIHVVYRGVFPNFFISNNNMIVNKLEGETRESLLQQLYQYYRMGVSCLLLSPTLRSILEPALDNQFFVLSFSENITYKDKCGWKEIFRLAFQSEELSDCYHYLIQIDKLSQLSITPYQFLTLQHCTSQNLVDLAFRMANSTLCSTHKNVYILDRMICNMLKFAAKLGPVSHLLYLALYYHKTGRYDKTLHITYLARQRMSHDFIMYATFVKQRYNEAVGNLSLSRRMRTAWVNHMYLFNDISCIELSLERSVIQQNGLGFLILSPFVLVDMLSVLSHYRLGNRFQCLQSLSDLQTLLLHDDGTYNPLLNRDISWQILGICQHVVGDLHGALESFEESLRQEPFHGIQEATDIRKRWVKGQLHRNLQT
ncbi:uncharacterized protein LOC134252582 [Saccostrea cucullata]|uniref:uncharacterized protein LOC134252582 n=1 Tax=Saccostrea cuccullata TaxID=36930 RepID=UPI002ED173BA